MKIKTEAAAVIHMRMVDLQVLADDARMLGEFGITQRTEQVIEQLEQARLFILGKLPEQRDAEPAEFVMPASFRDFLRTAPAGSRILYTSNVRKDSGYIAAGDGVWHGYNNGLDAYDFTARDFHEDEDDRYVREVPNV